MTKEQIFDLYYKKLQQICSTTAPKEVKQALEIKALLLLIAELCGEDDEKTG